MNKKNFLRTMITLVITFTMVNSLYPYVNCNGAGGGYEDSSDKAMLQALSIETLITSGAWYFLKSNSNIQEILAIIEGQDIYGVNWDELHRYIDNAILHLSLASDTYESLLRTAEVTPYSERVITKLNSFNYDSFMLKYNLNHSIFQEVKGYLQTGNITDIFKQIHFTISNMKDMLTIINSQVNLEQLPSLELCWQLNETISVTSLLGSYVARIFSQL